MVDDRDRRRAEALDQVLGPLARAAPGPTTTAIGIGVDLVRRPLRERVAQSGSASHAARVHPRDRSRRPSAAPARGGWRPRRRCRRRASARSRRPARRRRPRSTVRPVAAAAASFSIRKCVAASEATCGRWVMQITWRPSPSARSRSPTARAVLPPIPASISSKTSVPALAGRPEPDQRQHHPRQLAARGGVAQRRGRHPRVGGDPQLDRLGAARPEAVGVRLERDLERRAVHRQLGELRRRPAPRAAAPPPRARRR